MEHEPLTSDEILELLMDISIGYQRYAHMITRELWTEATEAQETVERAIVRLQRDAAARGL